MTTLMWCHDKSLKSNVVLSPTGMLHSHAALTGHLLWGAGCRDRKKVGVIGTPSLTCTRVFSLVLVGTLVLVNLNDFCLVWFGLSPSAKIVVHLHPTPTNKEPGPYQHSKYSFIKMSFKEHGQIEVVPHSTNQKSLWLFVKADFHNVVCLQFYRRLTEEMTQKRWENTPVSQPIASDSKVRNLTDWSETLLPAYNMFLSGLGKKRWK